MDGPGAIGAPGLIRPPSVSRDPEPEVNKFSPLVVPEPNTIPNTLPMGTGTTPPLFPNAEPGVSAGPRAPGLSPVPGAEAPSIPVAPVLPPPALAAIPGGASGVTPIQPESTPSTGANPAAGLMGNALPSKISQCVTLETVCPESVVFGQEFRYDLIIRNQGSSAASGIRVEDELPAGTKYISSDPPAEINGERLTWAIGSLDAGAEKRLSVHVKPTTEGEIRSRATVTSSASADARTRVTRPRVAVSVVGSELCRAGEETVFQIKLANSGTGPAQRMVLQAHLSEGLLHPQGLKIEAELANLPAGETKTIPLKVIAGKAGLQWCQITVAVEGASDATAKASVNVVEPLLQITQTGPGRCLVRAEPTYEIALSNPGTASTDPITLYAVLPEGFDFVDASESGSFNATNRAVIWKLSGLAAGGNKSFSLKLRATTAGDGLLRTMAQAIPEQPTGAVGAGGIPAKPNGRPLEAKTETTIRAEGVAAVRFQLIDLDDPVEVGKEAVYEIRVANQGTGPCTNVQLVAALAEGAVFTGSSGPTQVKAQGQHLMFEAIPTIPVKGEVVFRVKVRGGLAGDVRFRVQLTSDQVRTPVIKEESTRFYKE